MKFDRLFLCLLLVCLLDLISGVKISEFHGIDESHLEWDKEWKFKKPITSITLCARLKFSTLLDTNCFIQLDDQNDTEDYGNHQSINAILDLKSIWFSLGGYRTRHNFNSRFVAFTWYHVCVTYSHKYKLVSSYLDGELQQSFKGDLLRPIDGTRLKVGSCSKDKRFHGDLTQVNIWDRVLSQRDIAVISECKSDVQGNIVPWHSSWNEIGAVNHREVEVNSFCEDSSGPQYFVFPPMPMSQSYASCKGITGVLPTPESAQELDLYEKFASRTPLLSGNECSQYWVGASDSEKENKWLRRDESNVSLYWAKRQPDGQDTENCAIMKFGKSKGIYDTQCSGTACAVCTLKTRPIWSLMGSCEKYQRNRYFVAIQEESGQIVFNGYSDYHILQNEEGKWIWIDRTGNLTIATLISNKETSEIGLYPFGRKKWLFNKSICNQMKDEETFVLLTPCKDDEFTCNDAACIPLWQRCDLKPNCVDQSDEQNCRLIDIPSSYRADIPPLSKTEDTALPITLGVILESIDIHTVDMRMHVNINLTMTWRDSRVQFRNLNQDRTLNRVKYEIMKKTWVPVVDFTNTRGNHITKADTEATMAVNMQSAPTIGGDSQAEEVEFYSGEENSISIIRKYSETFQCHFDLSRYPFDEQICRMELTMLSASSRLLQFGNDSYAKFIGNTQLVEYTVQGVGVDIHNDIDFSVLFVEVGLVRRAGFILMNIYVPSMCLLIITYLTLYFKPAIFQVRVLATLTSLLVMTTLFTQASSHLPKTSYFKSVDVWLLTSLIIIFTVILCHIIIDRSIDDKPKMPLKSSIAFLVKKRLDVLPMTSVSPADSTSSSAKNPEEPKPIPIENYEDPEEIPWSKYLIISSRIFVLLGITLFNIGYWSVALT